ncbi:DUF4287 domain-containing protein [Phenylobacterium sp.]|uniref:DUF4287 domain-containing protein n=1 Tax=Phenylobacterium sp. TaxID=1871053 RepID=UPI002DE59B59|nr:DUF4287 domain-containing protein [Phenylobacterium sp.]
MAEKQVSATLEAHGLTERQKKWFASVQASLERDTGKTLEQWVTIAHTCPETKPRARAQWLKDNYGLLQNRAMYVLSEAFPAANGWDEPQALREALWTDPGSRAIFEAVQAAAAALPGAIIGQRKAFTAFSREFQFAAIKPVKGGKALLGLAIEPAADPRLQPPKTEGWSERLKSKLLLETPGQVDASVAALLKQAWEKS